MSSLSLFKIAFLLLVARGLALERGYLELTGLLEDCGRVVVFAAVVAGTLVYCDFIFII